MHFIHTVRVVFIILLADRRGELVSASLNNVRPRNKFGVTGR